MDQSKGVWIPQEYLNNGHNLIAGAILAKVASFAKNKKKCYCSNKHMAKCFNTSEETVKRTIRVLVQRKEIARSGSTSSRVLSLGQSVPSVPVATVNMTDDYGHSDPKLRSNRPTNSKVNSKVNTYTSAFGEFWKIYPRKVSKVKAYRCWKTCLKRGDKAEGIIEAAKGYAEIEKRKMTAENYIMHPATFLGPDEPWKDYLDISIQSEKQACPECHTTDGIHYAGCKRGGLNYEEEA